MKRAPGAQALRQRRPVMITGGAGFIGCNLANRLAAEGHDVLIFDALSRPGVERNLAWLKRRHPQRVSAVVADIRDRSTLVDATRDVSAIYHFAAQVAVTTSYSAPLDDFETNAWGTLLLLEAARQNPHKPPLIFASTNKVYGNLGDIDLVQDGDAYLPRDPDLRDHGIGEWRALDLHTPYGCSKGAADQYVLDYAREFGVPTAVLRMSCIYGERQLGTEDQGWVAHFVRRALADEPITIYGDGRQVRDILHVGDAVNAYMAAWKRIQTVAGQAFNLGGGPRNAISLRQLISQIEIELDRRIDLRFEDWRPGDQRYFVADTRRATATLGLPAARDWRAGVAALADWLQSDGESFIRRPAPVMTASAAGAAE